MPWNKGVRITPLPELERVDKMAAYVDDALEKGAVMANNGGGEYFGTLFRPAYLPGREDREIVREEQFGPVVPRLFLSHG